MRRLGLKGIELHSKFEFDYIGEDISRFAVSTPRDLVSLLELILTTPYRGREECCLSS